MKKVFYAFAVFVFLSIGAFAFLSYGTTVRVTQPSPVVAKAAVQPTSSSISQPVAVVSTAAQNPTLNFGRSTTRHTAASVSAFSPPQPKPTRSNFVRHSSVQPATFVSGGNFENEGFRRQPQSGFGISAPYRAIAAEPKNAPSTKSWLFSLKDETIVRAELAEQKTLFIESDYGKFEIKPENIISLRILKKKIPDQANDQAAARSSSFNPSSNHPPTAKTFGSSKAGEPTNGVEQKDDSKAAPETDSKEKTPVCENVVNDVSAGIEIVVATSSGDIIHGKCDLPPFQVNLPWGTATINVDTIDFVCNEAFGIKTIVNTQNHANWILAPVQLVQRQSHILHTGRNESLLSAREALVAPEFQKSLQ